MVQIYSENNTNYDYNGDAVLDPEVCDLKVVLNGSWEVTLECPLDEQGKFQTILTNAVLCTDTPQGEKQLFRLYDVQKTDIGVIAYARPIFLDSARDVFFPDCRPTELSGQDALDYLMKGTPYTGTTDITLKKTAYYVRKNLIEALAGNEENSFLNRWGGEIIYNNYNIDIKVQQGEDRGLRVEFGNNIQSIQETIDVDEMGTRLVPVAFNGRTLDGDEPWVDSPLIDNYPIVYTKIVEFDDMRLTEDFYTDEDGNTDEDMDDYDVYDTLAELQAAMVERCKQLFVEGIDTPTITYDISMVDLRNTDDYKEYQDLETVNLGDTVYCYHRKLGIETKARVIEYTYDCIRQCITDIVIGDYQEDYLDHLSEITSSSGGTVDFSQIWSQFDYIEANYVRTNQLEAEIAKFGYLTAAEADITYARITDLDAALITVNELIADQIYAVYADIGVLDASVANIISLLGGDIATGTLDTIHLTADNAVIDSEVVLQAIIGEAIIGDLLAGVIYTDQITIMDNENGDMVLTGPTIQFKDTDGNYRMQVGLDGEGNFNIYIFDETGNILFDALGLTEAGLIGNGAIIRDVAVADDANISGYKLNIQEVAECLTADGSLIVDAGQVIINGETLSTVYTEIIQDVNSALTEAEKALEAAGELIEIGARNYLLNTRDLDIENDKTFYTGFSHSTDESEFGVLTETGSGSFTDLTAISAEKNSLSGKKIVFSCELLEENLTSILEDYDLEFGVYRSVDNGETWNEYASISSSMAEDTVFEFNKDDLVDNEWTKLIAKFTANAAHIHTTDARPVFTWGDDNMTCTATFTCSSCGEVVTENCTVNEETVDATCTEDGKTTWTASITIGDTVYTDEREEVIPATGHDYYLIRFLWTSNQYSCQALFGCRNCTVANNIWCTVTHETTKPATCTEDGIETCYATVTLDGQTYTDTHEYTIENLGGHDYGGPTFEWADDNKSCTATFTCSRGDDIQTLDCAVEIVTIPATCEEDGMTTYTATITFNGKEYSDVKEEVIPATGHDYGEPDEVKWAADYSVCNFYFYCKNCGQGLIYTIPSTAETTEPTCTQAGKTVYTATMTMNGITYTETAEVEIPALGHEYGEPEFTWASDFSSCTATISCTRGDDTQTADCAITSERTEPTDTEPGKIVYTATCTLNGQEYTDVVEDTIPALGHTYGEPTFEWESDYSSCIAVFECINFDDTQRLNCDITIETEGESCTEPGTITYTATVVFNNETYTDEKSVEVEALGHDYGEPVFNWAADLSSCEAVFSCSRGDDTQTLTCSVDKEITQSVSCTEDGIDTYTATVTFNGKEYSDVKEDITPALGHDYGEPSFDWANDYSSCTAIFNCSRGDDTQIITCAIEETENIPADCTTEGRITYTASCTFNGKTYSNNNVETTPALGHDYGEPVFIWTDDYSSCVASFTCSRGDSTETVECTVTVDGDTYTATCEFNGKEYSDVREVTRIYAIAIYCSDDRSLTFYADENIPEEGSTYNNKAVTNVYTGFENNVWSSSSDELWYSITSRISTVEFDASFKNIQPVSLALWFYNCTSLSSLLNISNLDTSKVTSTYRMFYGCSALTELDLSNLDVSNVTNMSYMFYRCSGLKDLNLSNWTLSGAMTSIEYMFQNCTALTTLDLSTWNISELTTLRGLFFSGEFVTLDLSNWNTSNVTDMYRVFSSCRGLETVYVSNGQFNTDKVTNSDQMFNNCSELVGGNGTTYDSSKIDASMAHVDTASNPGYFTDIADKP